MILDSGDIEYYNGYLIVREFKDETFMLIRKGYSVFGFIEHYYSEEYYISTGGNYSVWAYAKNAHMLSIQMNSIMETESKSSGMIMSIRRDFKQVNFFRRFLRRVNIL